MDPMLDQNVALAGMDLPQPTLEDGDQVAAPISNQYQVDTEIRDMIVKRKSASRTWRQPKKDVMDKCWDHYNQVYDTTNKESWQATTFMPASPKVAEVITSNMHSALMGPDRPVEYQARRPEYEESVRDTNELISVDFEKSRFKVHWTDFLRTITIAGTAVGKVEYVKEWAEVTVKERVKPVPGMDMMRKMIGLAPQPTETTSKKRMLVKDFASFKNVDLYDIYPEPGTTDFSKDHWVIEEGKICNYKLLELVKDPDHPLRNVTPELLQNNPSLTKDADKTSRDESLNDPLAPNSYLDPDQEHKHDEYHGPAPIWMVQPELYGIEEHKYEMVYARFWLIDGQHVILSEITPWADAEPPYVKGVYIRVPGQWYGIGPLELAIGLQIELNEGTNCRQDEINLKLNAPVAVLKDSVADWDRLKLGPAAVWPFTGTDDIKKVMMKIELDGNLGESWRSTGQIYNEIQEVTAATKATVGSGGGEDQSGGATFRGQLLNKQTSSERFIMYARMLEITGLSDAIRKFYHRIYQFKGWEEAAQILGPARGEQFKFVPPELLDLMAKMVPLGVTTMENKGVKLAQMSEQYKMFSQEPWFKKLEFARRMVVVGGDADPDTYIFTDEEMATYNEQKLKLLMQAPPLEPGATPPAPGDSSTSPPPGPFAGGQPGPTDGLPRPAMPAQGPGVSPMDLGGRPM